VQDEQEKPQAEEPEARAQADPAAGASEHSSEQSPPDAEHPPEPDQPAGGDEPPPRPEPASDWPALDAYRTQLRAEHAPWRERIDALHAQLLGVRPVLDQIAAQYAALGVEEDLLSLSHAVLGGAGMVQRVRFDYDLERYVTLAWPAATDPRPPLAEAHDDGEYRVDVWFGIGPDGRGRVRVEGAKRLEAPLPTSRERLRGVLLAAIQSPRHVLPPAGEEGPMAGESPPAAEPLPEQPEQPVESASPRPGDPEQQPPPDEQVIPLGPAADEEKQDA
jgi:hypothetical protein